MFSVSALNRAALEPVAPLREDGSSSPLSGRVRFFKRLVDLTLAPLVLVLTLPVLVVAAVAIRLNSTGPAIFTQIRVGEGGRRFRMHKLRTMYAGNDDKVHRAYVAAMVAGEALPHGGMFKLVDDPRITTVGRFLRRFSIDELPQLWNVIRGDMSLIGPRPPLVPETELYDAHTWQRLFVKPGLTGLWQVSGRSTCSFEEMVELDIEYWRSWSATRELSILAKSLPVIVTSKGTA